MIKIKVVGVGGAGVNTVDRLQDKKLSDVELLAVNTDIQSLSSSNVSKKIQIGQKLTKGYGSGGSLEIGRMAANESRQDLARAIEGVELVVISAGLGGGTGGGASPVIARLSKEVGATVIAVVTTPFLFEGRKRMVSAEESISVLEKEADTIVVIPNQKLFNVASEEASLEEVFEKADGVLVNVIRSITDLITMPGLINLDFSNIRAVVSRGGRGFFGSGEAAGEDKVKRAVEEVFSSELLGEVDIKSAGACLINIYGSGKISFKEVNQIMKSISDRVDIKTNIVFGVTIIPELGDKIRITAIATGLKERTHSLRDKGDREVWPDTFDYTEELDTPSFLRKKVIDGSSP